MSWLQWMGETWPASDDEASLEVWLPAPDMDGPRQIWRFEVHHMVGEPIPGTKGRKVERSMDVQIGDLGLRDIHWHQLSGVTIRSTAAWYDKVEALNGYGKSLDSHMEIMVLWMEDPDADPPRSTRMERWMATDFTLSLGQRDGFCFPCEIDAWVMPEEDFHRMEAETPEELARFGEGPPHLRLMARAVFQGGQIDLERCGDDPLPLAGRRIREMTGCERVKLCPPGWTGQMQADDKTYLKRPGWRSTVTFRTVGWAGDGTVATSG